MSSFLDKLNLRAGERRLVVGVALVVFLIVNYFAVWGQFGEWGREQRRTKDAQDKYDRFKAEVDKTSNYTKELAQLEKLGGAVQSEAMAIDLQRKVTSLANLYGVILESSSAGRGTEGGGRTNVFFEERSLGLAFNCGEKELVDFLFNLVSDSAMIRAKSMNLSPDPSRMRLKGNLTLVASYQRKVPLKSATPATTTTTKTATPPAKTTPPPKTASTPAKSTNQSKGIPAPWTNTVQRPASAEKKK